MGKETKTITSYRCDRCAGIEDTVDSKGKYEWGEMDLHYEGHIGGRSVSGDAGGNTYKRKVWLCLHCTRDFLKFIYREQY
jgi:hypothetical protein